MSALSLPLASIINGSSTDSVAVSTVVVVPLTVKLPLDSSNTNLSLDSASQSYKNKFILSITKQSNHLINNIENEKDYEKKNNWMCGFDFNKFNI